MGYTNKNKVIRKGASYTLDQMSLIDLIILKSNLLLDVLDIENQLELARKLRDDRGTRYNQNWVNKAISAAKIKMVDVHKIEVIVDKLDISDKKEEWEYQIDLSDIDLRSILTKAMSGLVPDYIIDITIDRVIDEVNSLPNEEQT